MTFRFRAANSSAVSAPHVRSSWSFLICTKSGTAAGGGGAARAAAGRRS